MSCVRNIRFQIRSHRTHAGEQPVSACTQQVAEHTSEYPAAGRSTKHTSAGCCRCDASHLAPQSTRIGSACKRPSIIQGCASAPTSPMHASTQPVPLERRCTAVRGSCTHRLWLQNASPSGLTQVASGGYTNPGTHCEPVWVGTQYPAPAHRAQFETNTNNTCLLCNLTLDTPGPCNRAKEAHLSHQPRPLQREEVAAETVGGRWLLPTLVLLIGASSTGDSATATHTLVQPAWYPSAVQTRTA